MLVEVNKVMRQRRGNAGFTLLELMLVVGIVGAVLIVITQIFEVVAIRVANQRFAKQMLQIQSAAESYVNTNFNDLLTIDLPNAGDIGEITIADLKAENLLPAAAAERNRYNQNLTVYVRNLGDAFSGGDTFEVLALSEDAATGPRYIPNGRLRDIAKTGGSKLGYSSEIITAGEIVSIGGAWQVDRADFEAAGYNITPSAADGGYLAAYGRVSIEDISTDDVLYKIDMGSVNPEANVMETNLDMNNYGVLNASSVTIDRLEVAGQAQIQGTQVMTEGYLPTALSVSQATQFAGAASIRYRAEPDPINGDPDCALNGTRDDIGTGANCVITGGNVAINHTSTTEDALFVTGAVAMIDIAGSEGRVVAENIDVSAAGKSAVTFETAEFQDVFVNNAGNGSEIGSLTTFRYNFANNGQSLNITAAPLQVGPSVATNLGTVNTSGLLALNVNVADGTITMDDVLSTQAILIDGNMGVTGTTTVTDRIGILSKTGCNVAGSGDPC